MQSGGAQAWEPTAFHDYRRIYPRTPALRALPDAETTARFVRTWHALDGVSETLAPLRERTTALLVRGYLGNYMPGNFHAPRAALRRLGIDAHIVRNRAGGTVEENARLLTQQALDHVGRGRRILFITHSKGGLEALVALKSSAELARATSALILAQAPRGPSAVMESLLLRHHQATLGGWHRRVAEHAQRVGLHLAGAVRGGRQLLRDELDRVLADVDAFAPHFPVLQMASWSSTPTTWLDSFHQRLGEVRPGCAHDGQFFLEDLLWPRIPHVLLGHVDHAQPALGGHGFDHARYWLAVLCMLRLPG